jgi:tartrate dehydrogenase/decarboxylase / D-malate dehydrogenase
MKSFRIAVIPGDGIGKEVMPEGLRVLEAVGRKFDIQWKFDEFDWSCDYHEKHGRMMPEDGLEQLKNTTRVYFGAVGWPAMCPTTSRCGVC